MALTGEALTKRFTDEARGVLSAVSADKLNARGEVRLNTVVEIEGTRFHVGAKKHGDTPYQREHNDNTTVTFRLVKDEDQKPVGFEREGRTDSLQGIMVVFNGDEAKTVRAECEAKKQRGGSYTYFATQTMTQKGLSL